MTDVAPHLLAPEPREGGVQVVDPHVAQRSHAELPRRLLAAAAADAVLAVGVAVGCLRVHHDQ